ncbi:hypothetical protein ANN_17157 [Periplaneta americana]|uniref:DNA-directed RNA polymerases I, II, and III subunit RPABC3 n=1 Tax=Periplaneta americana TaxID=6978 RepID=A0ABQ8SS49_PERAM|nr:hypothetical protein ANN_17157 [Periplaneta americana]
MDLREVVYDAIGVVESSEPLACRFGRMSDLECLFTISTNLTMKHSIVKSENFLFAGDKFRLVLATTLREDGYPDSGDWNPMDTEGSRADSFEYVMYGKIYRIEGDETSTEPSSRLSVKSILSYGVLALTIRGPNIPCDVSLFHSRGVNYDLRKYVL